MTSIAVQNITNSYKTGPRRHNIETYHLASKMQTMVADNPNIDIEQPM